MTNTVIQLIDTVDAPTPPGPFSHCSRVGPWVFTSGMGGLDPKTGQVVSDDVVEQTRQSIRNVEVILASAGCGLEDVVKAVVFLTDMADFPVVNQVMAEYFSEPYPARAAIGVAALPKGAGVEMDAVVELGG